MMEINSPFPLILLTFVVFLHSAVRREVLDECQKTGVIRNNSRHHKNGPGILFHYNAANYTHYLFVTIMPQF